MRDADAPYSHTEPGVVAGTVGGNVRYAFNFDNPTGVKLLSERVFQRLREHLSESQASPTGDGIDHTDDVLYRHGLIKRRGGYSTAQVASQSLSLGIWLNVIEACNLGCFYCYIPELQKSVDPRLLGLRRFTLDEETIDVVVRRLIAYCTERRIRRLNVKFAGGEPTLAIGQVDQFCERLLARADNLEVTFGMITNGVFEAANVIPVIERRCIRVSISIDGMAENHDRIRFQRQNGVRSGTWTKARANAERLIEKGVYPYFLYTITRKNLGDLPAFAADAHGMGCGFRLSLERGAHPPNLKTQCHTAHELVRFYADLARTAPLGIRFDQEARFAEWNLRRKKRIACTSCRSYIAIGRGGEVASCQMRMNEPVGNLRDESLAASVDRFSELGHTRKLQRPEEKSGGCTRCEFRYVCAGGCPQHTREVRGDLDHPSPWCFVYGTLAPKYVEACATHLGRRLAAAGRLSGDRVVQPAH